MQHWFGTNNVRWRQTGSRKEYLLNSLFHELFLLNALAIEILLQAKQIVHTRAGDVTSKQQIPRANTKRAIEPKSWVAKETSTAAQLPGVLSDQLASMAIPNDLIGATVILHSPS